MPRSISAALQAELDKTVTQVGYLVQWNTAPLLRWSNLGDLDWASVPWVDFDFTVEGLRFDQERELECTIRTQNLDNAIAGQFLGTQMADVTVDLYQLARGALAAGDPVKLATFAVDSCEIGLAVLEARLVSVASLYAFSPRRRVDLANGFAYALQQGAQVAWENEIFVFEEDRG